MKHAVCVLASVVALSACNKSAEVNLRNATGNQVVQAVRQSGVANDIFLQSGEWRVTGTMEEMNIPGLPPEAQSEMKKAIGGQNMSYEYCLTPEEARQPRGKFFSGKAENNCRYDHFTMGGGKIDAEMRCAGERSSEMTMAIAGTYSSDSYSTHVSMNMQGSPQGSMSMKMRSEAHRIGECTAADLARAERESGTKG